MSEGYTRLRWTSEAGPESLFGGKDPPLFGRRLRRPRGPRLPVIAVTGFLGSGKTTLIRALLDKPEGANTAVVVNEYGEIGTDNALLRSARQWRASWSVFPCSPSRSRPGAALISARAMSTRTDSAAFP